MGVLKNLQTYWVCLLTLSFAYLYADQVAVVHDPLLPEKPVVVVIPSYNNSQWYERNLDSVISQKYSNFKVIYLDDCSPDGTGKLVEKYRKEHHLENKITLIRNSVRRGALANIYTAVHSCDDLAIVVTLDGDDWLKHEFVLTRVNKEYTQQGAWMTYGHYECYPKGDSEPQKEMKPVIVHYNMYREWDWITSHLRTFYAWLFKQIKLEDFLFEGNFFDVTWDMAFMFPMLEMSGERARPIPDILYVYNCANPINDFKTKLIRQIHCDKLIRSMPKYSRLKEMPEYVGIPAQNTVQVVVLSQDSPEKLTICLDSLGDCVRAKNFNGITVLYQAKSNENEAAYTQLQKKLASITFVHCTPETVKPQLLEAMQKNASEYLFLAHDGMKVSAVVDLDACMSALKKTQAQGVYCALGTNVTVNPCLTRAQEIPPIVWIEDELWAWQFKNGEQDWRAPYTFSMAFYRTADLLPVVQSAQFSDRASLEHACDRMQCDMQKVGLFFKTAKAVPTAQ